jgi:hypothetical protein
MTFASCRAVRLARTTLAVSTSSSERGPSSWLMIVVLLDASSSHSDIQYRRLPPRSWTRTWFPLPRREELHDGDYFSIVGESNAGRFTVKDSAALAI